MDIGFVLTLVESAKRHAWKRTIKQEPISVEVIKQLCDSYVDSSDLLTVRDLTMIILSFACFLRFDNLSSLECGDISFDEDHMVVNISKSKTDQYRMDNQIVIAKGSSNNLLM